MYDAYDSRKQAYTSERNKTSSICLPFPEFYQRFQKPGEKIIASCIARNYFEKGYSYTKRMCQMTASHMLRWLITVSTTFKEVDFDGSLLPLFIT